MGLGLGIPDPSPNPIPRLKDFTGKLKEFMVRASIRARGRGPISLPLTLLSRMATLAPPKSHPWP